MSTATNAAPAPQSNAATPAPAGSQPQAENNSATGGQPVNNVSTGETVVDMNNPAANSGGQPAPAKARKPLEQMTSADLMNLSAEELMQIEQEAANALASTNAPGQPNITPSGQPAPQVPDVPTSRRAADDAAISAALQGATTDPNGNRHVPPVPSVQQNQPPALPSQQPPAAVQPAGAPPELTPEQQVAYLQGQLAVYQKQGQQPPAQGGQPTNASQAETQRNTLQGHAQALQTNIGKLDQNLFDQRVKLAQQLQDGEIEMVDFIKQEHELIQGTNRVKGQLQDKLNGINEQLNAPNLEQKQAQLMQNPALKQWTADLESQNPWLSKLTQPILENLRDLALQDMEALGLNTDSVEGLYNLRVRIVQLGKEYGYEQMLTPLVQQPAAQPGTVPNGGGVPAQAGQPTLHTQTGAQPTPAQRADKLVLAQNHPPQLTTAGVTMPTDALSSSHLEGMSPAQLAQVLPQSTLEKLGGFA